MGKGPLQSAVLEECLLIPWPSMEEADKYTSVRMQSPDVCPEQMFWWVNSVLVGIWLQISNEQPVYPFPNNKKSLIA